MHKTIFCTLISVTYCIGQLLLTELIAEGKIYAFLAIVPISISLFLEMNIPFPITYYFSELLIIHD